LLLNRQIANGCRRLCHALRCLVPCDGRAAEKCDSFRLAVCCRWSLGNLSLPRHRMKEGSVHLESFAYLVPKRHRGWPWPEESFGMTPMFGDDGWCRSCGVPLREQIGPLILQRSKLRVHGAWQPNWQFDVICVAQPVARQVATRFDLSLLPIAWPSGGTFEPAFQIIIPPLGERWYEPAELDAACRERHGEAGKRCPKCQTWRWYPLPELPPPRFLHCHSNVAIAASPEVFGDGLNAFRQVLVRRELGELLTAASPRDLRLRDIDS
jgi:hypothetical protein